MMTQSMTSLRSSFTVVDPIDDEAEAPLPPGEMGAYVTVGAREYGLKNEKSGNLR